MTPQPGKPNIGPEVQAPGSAAAANQSDSEPLIDAAKFLVARGFYGLVWLDQTLVVVDRVGGLVADVGIGESVGLALLPFYGLDLQFHRLRVGERSRLELSNISVVGPDGPGYRLNFYVHWMSDKSRFLVIVARATTQDELEAELENQSRRRALAEAELVEKAKEIALANENLTRANRELSEFAYVISHDLKAPMRAMRYQIDDMANAMQEGDTANVPALILGLRRQERRMSDMLTDLLAYARIEQIEDAIVATDTQNLVERIVASLPRPAGFNIAIKGSWPKVELAAPALDLVIRNLIDNAIKHHDRKTALVTVSGRAASRGIEITISDDGPGIARPYHAAVFQPFRKVPTEGKEDVEGSGIGLALVRKTVETAGARLVLQSDPEVGRGTAFQLVWPGRIVA